MFMLFHLLLLALEISECFGACAMTQRCVNPYNIPDYKQCIPEAYAIPAIAKPVSFYHSTNENLSFFQH